MVARDWELRHSWGGDEGLGELRGLEYRLNAMA